MYASIAAHLVGILLSLSAPPSPETAEKVAALICQADYRGDLRDLQTLYIRMERYLRSGAEEPAKIRYWLGFAMWRRVVNGFNAKVDPEAMRRDAMAAVEEFEQAIKLDSKFADAKVGAAACMYLAAMSPNIDQEKAKALLSRGNLLATEARTSYPNNPRFLWVWGGALWSTATQQGGGEAAAIANYEKALTFCAADRVRTKNPLDPTWGEPELCMSLAWSHLNKKSPDLLAAERWARKALQLEPRWHYVKDILLPQIQKRKGSTQRS